MAVARGLGLLLRFRSRKVPLRLRATCLVHHRTHSPLRLDTCRGQTFQFQVKDRLGVLETDDQIEVVKHVRAWPFVDASRVAIFGWSYGGYMTLRALSSPERHLLAAGISVAPVADWHYYDASVLRPALHAGHAWGQLNPIPCRCVITALVPRIPFSDSSYTERYMHAPSENPAGYAESSVVEEGRALNLSTGPSMLLCFGSGDDNVCTRACSRICVFMIHFRHRCTRRTACWLSAVSSTTLLPT